MKTLLALLDGRVVAELRQNGGRTTLTYTEDWRADAGAYPLSLSMPLAAATHGPRTVDAYLWGLLPDNEHVLEQWSRKFHVSARNPFALLAHVGEDCAGAIQLVPPEHVAGMETDGRIDWLDEAELGKRLQALLDDPASGRAAGDTGQFSLAGAQPKTALFFDDGKWGVPTARIPTTHILKPATPRLPGHAENEHLCLRTADRLGLIAANSEVRRFGDIHVIVVERYDRLRSDNVLHRIHQEDMCQALAIHPVNKYQNDGGPGPADIVALLRASVRGDAARDDARDIDIWRFVDALLFAWLTGGTDAHAKNYSLLLDRNGIVRLAPLYDLASIYGLPDVDRRRAKLAMRVAGHYRLEEIVLRHWEDEARSLQLDSDRLVSRARELAAALPDTIRDVAATMRREGIDHPVLALMTERIASRAAAVA